MKRLMNFTNKIFSLVLSAAIIVASLLGITILNVNAQSKNYVALGDSISTGYGLANPSSESFVNILTAENGYTLTNYAVNGNTTAGLMAQTDKTNPKIDASVLALADVITISIGGNDAMNVLYQGVADAMKITLAEAQEKLLNGDFGALINAMNVIKAMSENPNATIPSIIASLKTSIDNIRHYNKTAQIVLLTQYNPYLWIKEPMLIGAVAQMNTYLAAFRSASYNSSFKDEVVFADAFTLFENAKNGESLANATGSPVNLDFHPNKLGHSKIAALVKETLLKPFINEKNIANAIVQQAFSVKLTSKGAAPISWTISSGALPTGLDLNSDTGEISGTPTAVGIFTFSIMASNPYGTHTTEFTIDIMPIQEPPIITTENIPPCTIGVPYSYTFKATGTAPIKWKISALKMPSGLTFNQDTGELSGTPDSSNSPNPTKPNEGMFFITAMNNVGQSPSTLFGICIAEKAGAPTIPAQLISNGTVGTIYKHQITATATGTPDDNWRLEPETKLPAGLTLNAKTGIISGTPTESGSFTFSVSFSNSFGSYFRTLSFAVAKPPNPAVITSTSLENAVAGIAYSQTLQANGDSPIAWTVESGNLPTGLLLNPQTGEISGTPTDAGTFNFKIKATNSDGSDAKDFSITITFEPIYTVTIPTKIEFGGVSKALKADTANRYAKSADAPISVSYVNLFNSKKTLSIAVGSDFNLILNAESFPFTLYSENTELSNNSMVFDIVPTELSPDNTIKIESKNLFAKLDQSKINHEGNYTGTIIFTIELKEANQ